MATTNPPDLTASNATTSSAGSIVAAGGSTPSLPTGPPKYAFKAPPCLRATLVSVAIYFGRSLKVLAHLIGHALGSFEPLPTPIVPLTLSLPTGSISPDMLAVCERLAEDADARLTKLETKATGLLSLIAVVIPLTVSAAVFIRQHSLPLNAATSTLTLNIAALLCFALGLFAALRAMAVRDHQKLFLDAVIDPASDSIRTYSPDFYGRGLLYVASTRQAICDHIADFVRGSQVLLVLGVLLAANSAGVILFYVHEDTQSIQGTVGLDAATIGVMQKGVESTNQASAARLSKIESDLEALRQVQSNSQTAARLEQLSAEVTELRKQSAARPEAKAHSSGGASTPR